jgi:hypothetical protein
MKLVRSAVSGVAYRRRLSITSRSATWYASASVYLAHVMYRDLTGELGEDRVVSFLRSATRPLAFSDLRCNECGGLRATFCRRMT